jgi:DNA-binding LytR/AlgR family response regulator
MKCIIVDDNILALKATEQFVQKVDYLTLAGTFGNPVSALSFVSQNKVDLVFLDVEMPEMNGIEFLKSLKHPAPQIILTTTHKDYAPEAFEHNVTDYLVKPIVHSRFMNSVSKAKEVYERQRKDFVDSEAAFIKKGSSIIKINKSDVLWIESLGDYVTLNTENEKHIVHSTMQEIMEKFPEKDFIRVHRSFIIRINKIENIEDDLIHYGKQLIPIGKTYRQEVFKRLNML